MKATTRRQRATAVELLAYRMEKRYEYGPVDIQKTSNNPPHFFLEKPGLQGVLQKSGKRGLRKHRWSLLLKGAPPLFFPSRKRALSAFLQLTQDDLKPQEPEAEGVHRGDRDAMESHEQRHEGGVGASE